MSNGINPCEALLIRWLINNQVTWVTWLWLWVSGLKPVISWTGRWLFNVFVHVILGGPIWPIPSLCLSWLVSAIPHTFLIPCGPSQIEVQVRDSKFPLCFVCLTLCTNWNILKNFKINMIMLSPLIPRTFQCLNFCKPTIFTLFLECLIDWPSQILQAICDLPIELSLHYEKVVVHLYTL